MADITSRLNAALAERYRIERELGAGGMATVYLAEDVRHKRRVALKVLRPELAAVLGAERFLSEIQLTANLQHPHILPLFDSGEADSFLYYVMPFVDGETLREKLDREKQLGLDEAVRIAGDVADALDYAHRHGVIHRDIKPANILLHDGRPVVADFGIALAVSAAGGGRMTETGLSLGTPHYMSPEQASADRDLSARSDVYSLGCVLYEMLAGQPPHTGPSAQTVLVHILTKDVTPLTELRQTVPPHVAAAVAKSIEKLPADRFETAQAFREALGDEGFTYQTGPRTATAAADSGGTPAGPYARPWYRDRRAAGPTAVAAAMAALAAWGWLGRGTTVAPPPVTVRTAVSDIEFPGFDDRPEISRDGSLIAVRRPSAGPQLFVRRSDELAFRALPGTEGAEEMSFSPDGKWLAFRQGDQINRVEVSGGPVLPVARGTDPHWGTEDMIVFVRDRDLFTVSPKGGEPIPWPGTDSLNATLPFLLPNGRAIVFSGAVGSVHTLMLLDLSSGRVNSLGLEGSNPRYVPAGYLLFGYNPGQALMAVPFDPGKLEVTGEAFAAVPGVAVRSAGETMFTVSDNGTAIYSALAGGGEGRLVEVDVDGSSSDTLPLAVGTFEAPRYSPDGRQLAYVGDASDGGIWLYDRETGAKERIAADGHHPAWSRDGRDLYYRLPAQGVYRVSLAAPTDTEQIAAQRPGQSLWPLSTAPDGEVLLGEWSGAPRGLDLLIMSHDQASPSPRDYLVADWNELAGAISPDGKWVAYTSNESGTYEVYVRSLSDAGGQVQISSGGGVFPRWAPDGAAIYYASGGQQGFPLQTMWRSEVRSGESFQAGPPKLVFQGRFLRSPAVFPTANFDLDPDGSRFVMVQPVGGASSSEPGVYLVTNWFEELRRRAAN